MKENRNSECCWDIKEQLPSSKTKVSGSFCRLNRASFLEQGFISVFPLFLKTGNIKNSGLLLWITLQGKTSSIKKRVLFPLVILLKYFNKSGFWKRFFDLFFKPICNGNASASMPDFVFRKIGYSSESNLNPWLIKRKAMTLFPLLHPPAKTNPILPFDKHAAWTIYSRRYFNNSFNGCKKIKSKTASAGSLFGQIKNPLTTLLWGSTDTVTALSHESIRCRPLSTQ